ncbi:penicillin-binding transpeptidase domain-containing protein [Clostridium sp. UBA4395]|uniref:penicillin-binding transpeptidase domain-containing protein n=1 Tax=Clostridium sp. UBA4395 TaxID=1946360 RepID=UPI00321753B0
MKKNKKSIKNKKSFSRYNLFYIAMVAIFVGITSRLLFLQIVMVDDYRETANSNKYKTVSVAAARGDIVDRNGKVFAESIQNYVLQFSETEESKKHFFKTMSKVFEILDKKQIPIVDEFPIIINNKGKLEYNFKAADESSRKWLELRFKKDRGFLENVVKKEYGEGKKGSELTEEQKKYMDTLLLQITAEEAYKTLEKDYGVDRYYELTLHERRRFLLLKDAMKMRSFSGYSPVVIANTLDQETAFVFEQLQPDMPGIIVDTQPMRSYPNGELGSAFLGYMSQINPWEQGKYEEKGYDVSTDNIGKAGIEAAYESYLKGTKGQESIEINKQGRRVRTLGQVEAYQGKTVQLNIDMDVQRAAEKALDEVMTNLQKSGKNYYGDSTNATRGAAVAISTKGEVLALVSKPGFDPNIFTDPGKLTTELSQQYFNPDLEAMGKEYIKKRGLANIKGILTDKELTLSLAEREKLLLDRMFPIDKSIPGNTKKREDRYDIFPKPFYNYGTLSLVPPGSTFKPVTALAGLEEGVITGDTDILDDGIYGKYGYGGSCWIYNMNNRHGSHGRINVKEALEVSCNYFFFDVADRLFTKGGGMKNPESALNLIAEYGWKLGLGLPQGSELKASTGIEIEEYFGQVYNYESNKNVQVNTFTNQMVEYLQKGISSVNAASHYKPFDITQKDESGNGKELDQIKLTNTKKKTLVDMIKGEMKKDEKPDYDNIMKKLKPLVEDIINTNEEIKALGYSEADIDNIVLAIYNAVNDTNGYIKSPANAYDASIGQGINQFTPLQLASYLATLLNGGERYEVKLVDKIIDSKTKEVIEDIEPKLISKASFNKANIDIIKEGMGKVTQGENGTTSAVFNGFPIPTGGKTGTSNVVTYDLQKPLGRDAASVYVGFAPYDNPEIVVCSIVFDAAHGDGTIAKAMFEAYFKEEILKTNPNYEFKYK